MKRFLLPVLLFCSLIAAAQNNEFRATWVVTWEYISSSGTVEENKARIIKILEDHKKANMNAVIWQVRQSGSAYYNSSYEPWGFYAGGTYPGFDPLAFVIEEAHKRGMEVHVWFNTFMISSAAADRVTGKHPDWVCTDRNGTYMSKYLALSPCIPEVRKYTLDVAMEIVNNYDIDGLHLDYVRWNEYDDEDMTSKSVVEFPLDGMVSQEKLKRLESEKSEETRFIYDSYHPYSAGIPEGYSDWNEWRRAGVTEFVKMVHDSIQKVKPYVRLSVAALGKYKAGGTTGWNGYYTVFQDAALWFNKGYVDQLTPMHYHWLTGDAFLNELASDWEPEIAEGIAAGRLYSVGPGSYILDENNVWNNHGDIITKCRTKNWVDGFQFFSYASWRDRDYWAEAGSDFFSRKTKIRPVTIKTPPQQPSLTIEKVDSLKYNLNVMPGSDVNCWYVIYRSSDSSFDSDNDQIVHTVFGNQKITYCDTFDGLQSFNGKYYYFAVAYNRYWNESTPSNPVTTDNIPSFAPVVTRSVPSENGLIPVNGTLSVTFSKEMNVSSISGAFKITPSATPLYTWSSDKRTLYVTFAGNLNYDTGYTLTLSPDLKDINGRSIDGDSDGISGDDFILHFRTLVKDSKGPVMTSSTLSDNEKGVDVSSVYSFTFNEPVLKTSVGESSVSFKDSKSNDVPFSALVYQTPDNKGVISVIPAVNLRTSENYTLSIDGSITDTLYNAMGSTVVFEFTTSPYSYKSVSVIDDFSSLSGWQTPSYSGSTVGIKETETTFSLNTDKALPSGSYSGSGELKYSWDMTENSHLIREVLSSASTKALITFDTTYVLQTYILGDSSNVKFRFCIDENNNGSWNDHEVSKWQTINWYGWKLVEWKLSNSSLVGEWISADNALKGALYRTDSFQFTNDNNSDNPGIIYFDNYRAAKKDRTTTDIDYQSFDEDIINCYPNPSKGSSNLILKIKYEAGYTVSVYNLSGQKIEEVVSDILPAGEYVYTIGNNYKPGIYIIEVRTSGKKKFIRFVRS